MKINKLVPYLQYHSFFAEEVRSGKPDWHYLTESLINVLNVYNKNAFKDSWYWQYYCCDIIQLILRPEYSDLLDIKVKDLTDEKIKKIFKLTGRIVTFIFLAKRWYYNKVLKIRKKRIYISWYFISLIMYLTLGCLPLYGSREMQAMRYLGIYERMSKKSLKDISSMKKYFKQSDDEDTDMCTVTYMLLYTYYKDVKK